MSPSYKYATGIIKTFDVDDSVWFHGVCHEEEAPYSVIRVNQLMSYFCLFNLSSFFRNIIQQRRNVIFGSSRKIKLSVKIIGSVIIWTLLSGECFIDYKSILIRNGVLMLMRLQTQLKL